MFLCRSINNVGSHVATLFTGRAGVEETRAPRGSGSSHLVSGESARSLSLRSTRPLQCNIVYFNDVSVSANVRFGTATCSGAR